MERETLIAKQLKLEHLEYKLKVSCLLAIPNITIKLQTKKTDLKIGETTAFILKMPIKFAPYGHMVAVRQFFNTYFLSDSSLTRSRAGANATREETVPKNPHQFSTGAWRNSTTRRWTNCSTSCFWAPMKRPTRKWCFVWRTFQSQPNWASWTCQICAENLPPSWKTIVKLRTCSTWNRRTDCNVSNIQWNHICFCFVLQTFNFLIRYTVIYVLPFAILLGKSTGNMSFLTEINPRVILVLHLY